jgi:hypothetical protein
MPDSTATTPARRTLVVGAGAVGSFLGALLGSVGHDVTLVRIFEKDSERPLVLTRPDGSQATIPVHRFTKTEDAPAPDLILVAVKMPMLREALAPTLRWPTTFPRSPSRTASEPMRSPAKSGPAHRCWRVR